MLAWCAAAEALGSASEETSFFFVSTINSSFFFALPRHSIDAHTVTRSSEEVTGDS